MDARHHIEELQSLRGVAALVVAISHLSSIYLLPAAARTAIDAVCNAHASVIVFFVLSGYVLTGSLLRRGLSRPHVEGFSIGRLFRLFPALWVASAVSALFLFLCPKLLIRPEPTNWFSLYLHPFPSGLEVLSALAAIDKSLIMPVWTIFIELMGSAIMPFIVMLALMKRRLFGWVLFGMGVAAYSLAHAPHRLNSLPFIFDFMLGAWLASRKWRFVVGKASLKLLSSALVLIFFRSMCFTLHNGHLATYHFGYDDALPMLVEGIAAFFLIGLLASEHGRIPDSPQFVRDYAWQCVV